MRRLMMAAMLALVAPMPAVGAPPEDIAAYCNTRHLNYARFVVPAEPSRPARPRTAAEIEAQTKKAQERASKPGARCTTKAYGGGAAVTICE